MEFYELLDKLQDEFDKSDWLEMFIKNITV